MATRAEEFPALLERLRPECEEIIARYEHSRSALLPLIHLFQSHEGYASAEAQRAVADMLALTTAVVESTVSFYTLFFRKPVGKYVLQVCRGLACSINGAEDIMAYFREKLGIGHLETTPDGLFSYEEVECLAACDRATCMQVNLDFVYDLTPQMIDEMLDAMRAGTYSVVPMAQTDKPERTWKVLQDTQVSQGGKSLGAIDQPNPNNGSGVDKDGVIMIDRILAQQPRFEGRTKERLANVEPTITTVLESEDLQ
ncbi:MAG TPA: NAD(P)H-dependent oxidoreductase subunit E [Candidatus Baltobacteraceae bacterium]|nr:NAD(P)H-dependent oxidoreductase subunit E [Candidatus Baltobacteraceae bacterium]